MVLSISSFVPRLKSLYAMMLVLASGFCVYLLGYSTPRDEFGYLIAYFSIAFFICLVLNFEFRLSFVSIMLVALGLRIILLFSTPQLSDDYFRYFFDGHLIGAGINPYLHTPSISKEMLPQEKVEMWEELYSGMNSKEYYTIYPPLHQAVFFMATYWSGSEYESLIQMRLMLIFFDLLNILLLGRLMRMFGIEIKGLVLYAFNPLVILELTGNLHFEGIVLTFLLATVFFIKRNNLKYAAIAWGLAVGLKLVPLILAPLWFFGLQMSSRFRFFLASGTVMAVLFLPFLNFSALGNFLQSFMLFQRKFEFNASLYYMVREVGMWIVGYNPIGYVAPAMSLAAAVLIFVIAYLSREKAPGYWVVPMVWIYMAYLLFQPVVHPWYIIPVLGLGVLTKEWTPIIWSGLIFFSYAAYQNSPVKEQPLFLLLQYGPVYLYIGYSLWRMRRGHLAAKT